MGLPGPARRITVEPNETPLTLPKEWPAEAPAEPAEPSQPERVEEPEKVPA